MKERAPTQRRSPSRNRSRTTARGGMARSSRRRTSVRSRGATTRSQRTRTRARSSRRTTRRGRASGRNATSTTDHDQIRRWVESRGGHPAIVRRAGQEGGILRIDFPGFSGGATLKPVSWEEWFDVFEQQELAFLHQDKIASGKSSRFNKLVSRS